MKETEDRIRDDAWRTVEAGRVADRLPEPGAGDVDRDAPSLVTCARHPSVVTGLRCSRCGTPICPKCMVQAPVGVRCPACAKPSGGLSAHPGLGLYLRSVAAGLGVGVATGALLVFVGLGFLTSVLMLLAGYLVGEAVSRVSRRLPYRELAVVAFGCAVVGQFLGRVAIMTLLMPMPGVGARALLAATSAVVSLGPFGLLVLVMAGVIAAGRVAR